MRRYRLSPAAVRDLEEIESFITNDDPEAGARLIDTIESTCELIAEFPNLGRVRDDIGADVMSFPVGS